MRQKSRFRSFGDLALSRASGSLGLAFAAAALAAFLGTACKGPICDPGTTAICNCSATQQGVQSCEGDGMSWSACGNCGDQSSCSSGCDDGNPCTLDVCASESCTHAPLAEGSACGVGLTCQSGQCSPGGCTPITDCDDGNPCTYDTCTAGSCSYDLAPDGTACGTDGTCAAGQCTSSTGCTSIADCDDGNACTQDACTAGSCTHDALTDGTSCSPGKTCSAGQCVGTGGCTIDDECNDQNPCTQDLCQQGACANTQFADGTVCGANLVCTEGHCGAPPECTTDANCNDSNVCTQDLCQQGICTHPSVTDGVSCGTSLVCKAGQCVTKPQCAVDAECTDTNACTQDLCQQGVCTHPLVTDGVVCGTNLVCKIGQCVTKPECTVNADCDDLNACTQDLCQQQTCSHQPVAVGTACNQNGGTVCSAAGQCVGCVSATTCPGTDTECKTRTCTAGQCGFAFTAAGTATSAQTAGNCKKNQCDGAGNIVAVNDNLDWPVDGNPCTNDVCTAGVPSNPALADGTSCGVNLICKTGQCVTKPQCTVNADCNDNNACTQDVCQQNVCSHPQVANGTSCGSGMACTSGQCTSVCGATPQVAWVARAPLAQPDLTITSTVLNGEIHVFGATHYRWHRIFTPNTNAWVQKADVPSGKVMDEGGAAIVNGVLYAFDAGTFGTANAMQWNPSADTWTVKAVNPWPRRYPATGVINGKVYLAGGFAGNDDKTNVYDPGTDTWQDLAPITHLAGGVNTAVVHGGQLYVMGVINGSYATRIASYSPATNSWATLSTLSQNRYMSRAVLVGSTIWLLGGDPNGNTISIYHIDADTWCDGPSLPEYLFGFAAELVNGKIYMVGGYAGTSHNSTNHVWEGTIQ